MFKEPDFKDKIFKTSELFASGRDKDAKLKLSGWKGFYRFHLHLSPKRFNKEKDDKNIYVGNIGMNKHTLIALSRALQELPKKEVGYKLLFKIKSPLWVDEQMTEDTVFGGSIEIGRRKLENGDIFNYLKAKFKNEKEFVFKLGKTPYVELIKNDKPLSVEEDSNIFTKAYGKLLEDISGSFAEMISDEEK